MSRASNFKLAAMALMGLICSAAAQAQSSPSPYTTGTRYDIDGRVTGVISPDPDGIGIGTLNFPAVRNSYDAAGRLVKVETGELASWQSEAVEPANWPGFTVLKSVDTSYDILDRKLVELVRGSVASGAAVHTLTQFSYDGDGRLECTAVRMNPAAFGSLPTSACSLGTEGSDGPDRIIKNIHDPAGQLLQVREGVGTSVETAVATYTYSPNGNKLTLADGKSNLATFEYDPFDRQIAWRLPSASNGTVSASCNIGTVNEVGGVAGPAEARSGSDDCEKYAYDRNGNRMTLVKRDGAVLRYNFDAMNRMAVKEVPQRANLTAAQTRDVYYGYDLRGLMTKARFGEPLVSDEITNSYNGFGDLISSSTSLNGFSKTVASAYDKEGKRIELTHDGGQKFTYVRDGLGRVSAIYEGAGVASGARLIQASYDHRGLVAGIKRSEIASGLNTTYTYDAIGRLGRIDNVSNTAAANLIIDGPLNGSMSYSAASQIVSQRRSNDAYSWAGSVAVNRTYTTNGLNQYTVAGPATFTYDLNGNLSSDGSSTFVYDIENRLVSASGAKTATLTYDPMGRLWRVTGTVSGGSADTRFVYDSDELIAEFDVSGQLIRRYVHSDNADDPVIQYNSASVAAAARRYLMSDERGSIVATFDDSGNNVSINTYDEYGIPGSGNIGRFQYTGQAWLAELGMYHYKARVYSPTLGRFLQNDPIGYDDQYNLYTYVANDPINATDPDGEVLANLGGAVLGAGSDVAIQMIVEGKSFDEVDLGRVATSALLGAAGLGLGKNALRLKSAYSAAKEAKAASSAARQLSKKAERLASEASKRRARQAAYHAEKRARTAARAKDQALQKTAEATGAVVGATAVKEAAKRAESPFTVKDLKDSFKEFKERAESWFK